MEPIDLIAMDMDGTLLVHENMVPEENIAALREAHRRGIHLALCSGRIPDDMGFFALDMGLPMHILSLNGTCMMDKPLGAIQRSDTIAPDDVRGILALLHTLPVAYSLFGGHEIITSMPDISDDELRIIIGKNVTRPGGRTMIRRGGEGEQALADRGVNICNFSLSRRQKGGVAVMTIEMDGGLDEALAARVRALPDVRLCVTLLP